MVSKDRGPRGSEYFPKWQVRADGVELYPIITTWAEGLPPEDRAILDSATNAVIRGISRGAGLGTGREIVARLALFYDEIKAET